MGQSNVRGTAHLTPGVAGVAGAAIWNAPAWLEKAMPADGSLGGEASGAGGHAADAPADPEPKKPTIASFSGKGAKLGKK